MLVTEDRIEKALAYLHKTGEEYANARALMLGLDKREKTILSTEILKHEGTVSERESKARTSDAFKGWQDAYQDSVLDFETLKTKRDHELLVIEVWRTESANQRKGHI